MANGYERRFRHWLEGRVGVSGGAVFRLLYNKIKNISAMSIRKLILSLYFYIISELYSVSYVKIDSNNVEVVVLQQENLQI